ncbi:hypothetical protein LOAG_16821 [Loa loa]|uniref:Uncharacterized protein n=1 Tax=Loa loa TaxID=7209 RepID=A0A1S0UL89_LOALO|nr:hypothetical protein LOAG_16821 [Loa loa]EJD76186.1 hypothetical protein LOAG_16821 [Loa loa]
MSPHSHRKDTSNRSVDHKGSRLSSQDAQIVNEGDREAPIDEEEREDGSYCKEYFRYENIVVLINKNSHNLLNIMQFIIGKYSETSTDIQKPQRESDILDQSEIRTYQSAHRTEKEEQTGNGDEYEKLKQQKEEVERELIEKERRLNNLVQTINDLQFKLSEQKQYSDVTQARVKDLETMLDEERNKGESLMNLNTELNMKIESLSLSQQPEIEYDGLRQSPKAELEEKNYEIEKLNKKIDELKLNLDEYTQWLEEANDRTNHLENVCKERDCVIDDVTNKLHDVERRLHDISTPQSTENLNSLIDDLRKEINQKNDYIDQLEKAKNDAQWYLGEHQHWLQDANTKIGILENEKLEGWRKVCELEEMLSQAEIVAATIDNYSEMKGKMEELEQIIEEKKREYDKLNEQKNEIEVILEDAKKRIQYLEDEEAEKDLLILSISKELGELKAVRIDAFQQLHEKIDSLEICLKKKEQQQIIKAESGDAEIEYKKVKWLLEDLEEDIFDVDDDHFNDSIEPKNKTDLTFIEQFKRRIKELENATQKFKNDKDAAIAKLYEIEPKMEDLKKEIQEKDQQIIQMEKDFNEKQNELNSFRLRIDELLHELNETNQNAISNEQKRMDTEWSLGEHRQWLADSKNKIDELENKLQMIGQENDSLREEIEKLNSNIRTSKKAIDSLQKEIGDKDEQLNYMLKQKNDAEWNVGEQQQLLKNANNRINELESVLNEKNYFIEELKKHNEERYVSLRSYNSNVFIFKVNELAALRVKLQDAEKALTETPSQDKMK